MTSIITSLSRDLMLSDAVIRRLVSSAPYRYKVFQIDKKDGKSKRTIAQPAREIKALQYWVIENILKPLPVHSAATAYQVGCSISRNAAAHARQRFLLKLDFSDFFHSITSDDLEAYLTPPSKFNLRPNDISFLKRILFWNRNRAGKLVLSIGAPSSPLISNVLLYKFDEKVHSFCERVNAHYTRYADDLTFSANRPNVLKDVEAYIETLCKTLRYPNLRLNLKKTVHASRKSSRRVTGLVLSNEGKVSLGRERKRLIRSQVHHYKVGKLKPKEIASLRGMLAFVNSTEPSFLRRLKKAYGSSLIARIMELKEQPVRSA